MIKNLLRRKGKDAQWLAKRIGVSHQAVYSWENRKTRPLPKNMLAMSKVLGVKMDTLVDYFYKK